MTEPQFSRTIKNTIAIAPVTLLSLCLSAMLGTAQAQLYQPIPVTVGNPIKDTLSDKDIPTGKQGFARDYIVRLEAGDKVAIAVESENFDTFVMLIASDGSILGENDDRATGDTNSLLVTKIDKTEDYIIRVRASGDTKAKGSFTLKVTHQNSKP